MPVHIGDVFNATPQSLSYNNRHTKTAIVVEPADTGAQDIPIHNFLGKPDSFPGKGQERLVMNFDTIAVGQFYHHSGQIFLEVPIDGEGGEFAAGRVVASVEDGKKYSLGFELEDQKPKLCVFEYDDEGSIIKSFSDLIRWAGSNLATLILDILF